MTNTTTINADTTTTARRGGQLRREALPAVAAANMATAKAALAAIEDRFAGHQPGEAYVLHDREEFLRFAEELWDHHRVTEAEGLWPHLQDFSRRLAADPEARHHLVDFRYNFRRERKFVYITWSGTRITVRESAQAGFTCTVEIPEHRDFPGRTAWTQIRMALSGLPYSCWWGEAVASRADAPSPVGARDCLRGLLRSRED